MPYHLPDKTIIGSCTIKFAIPNDPKWATVLMGAISELARLELWEAGTGGITAQQAIVTALEIRESVEFLGCIDMQIKVGSYTGDGGGTQGISGVGFSPSIVLVWMRSNSDSNAGLGMRAIGDSAAFNVQSKDGVITDYRATIDSLDADGFTVTNAAGVDLFNANESARTYTYFALGE